MNANISVPCHSETEKKRESYRKLLTTCLEVCQNIRLTSLSIVTMQHYAFYLNLRFLTNNNTAGRCVATYNDNVCMFSNKKCSTRFELLFPICTAQSDGAVCDSFPIVNSRYMVANFRHKLCAFHKFSLQPFLRLHHHADGVYFFSVNPVRLLLDWFMLT